MNVRQVLLLLPIYIYIYADAVCDYEGMLLGLAIAMSGGVNMARARLGGASYDCAIACFLCNVTPHCSASSYPVLNVHVSEPNDAFASEELGYQARTGHASCSNKSMWDRIVDTCAGLPAERC